MIRNKKSKPNWFSRVANMGRLLFDSVIAVAFVMYGIGMYGVIQSIKAKDDKECNFYTLVTCCNLLIAISTIYLISLIWD